ncbi:MAG: hypothetical protein ACREO3_01670, partial [Arenimonas sp.]
MTMGRGNLLFALAGLVFLAGSALFVFNGISARGARSTGMSPELVAALDRINDNQARLADRLDRIEA